MGKTVTINLDKERHLTLNLNAMVAFEKATGKSLFQPDSLKEMTASDIRALLWACMLQEEPALTLEQVGAMITFDNMAEVNQAIAKAWEVNSPDPLAQKTPG